MGTLDCVITSEDAAPFIEGIPSLVPGPFENYLEEGVGIHLEFRDLGQAFNK